MSKPFCESGSLPSAGSVRPYTVGITGSRGTGKSAVGEILQARHAAEVIDTDHLTHELLSGPCEAYNEVLARFGNDLAVDGGPINRKLLGERAFMTLGDKAALEAIMFPRINERLETRVRVLQDGGAKVVFVLVPLLHEAGMADYFDEVWCVVANEAVRLNRLMLRDSLSAEEAQRLISLQMTQTEKAKLSDHLIDNSWDIEKTAELVKEQHDALMQRVEAYFATAVPQPAEPASTDDTGAEAPTGDGTEAPTGDGTEAPTGDGTEAPTGDGSTAPSGDANERYRRHLRRAAEIGTEETISQLGDVAETQGQEASAKITLTVDRQAGDQKQHREFDVEVTMRARNEPGKPPKPDGNSTTPPPPSPPRPGDGRHSNRLPLVVLGLFGLLAFLFACLMLWKWNDNHHHGEGNKQQVTIINNIPCGDCKTPPIVVEPPVIVNPPFVPPAEPQAPCAGSKQVFDEVPGFAFRFVHNVIREQVRKYDVTFGQDCKAATVAGFDASGKLLVYQEYDSHSYMTYQFVMSYFQDGTVQVDRFEGRQNIFTGRSVYRFNRAGSVVRAEHSNGDKRLVYAVTFLRNGSGTTTALTVEEFDIATGAPLIKRTVEGTDSAAEFMRTKFYVFSWFAQL